MPIRAKILNVEKASIDKVLANAGLKTMINAFGCGFSEGYGNDFDMAKLAMTKSSLWPMPMWTELHTSHTAFDSVLQVYA